MVAQPPIYTETFLMSKIQNLLDDGFEVIIFSNLKRQNNTKAPLYSSYTELSLLQLLYHIPYIFFKMLQNYRTILRYKKLINSNVFIYVWEAIKHNEKIMLYTSSDAYCNEFFTANFSNLKFDVLLDDGQILGAMSQARCATRSGCCAATGRRCGHNRFINLNKPRNCYHTHQIVQLSKSIYKPCINNATISHFEII